MQVQRPTTTTSGAVVKPAMRPSAAGAGGDGVTKRLQNELMGLMMSGDKHTSAFPDGDNLFKWIGTIKGSEGTAFEGLTYKLDIRFPSDYPYAAPQVLFLTPCFHPNVDLGTGSICLDILKDKWSASLSISSVLQSLCSLLSDPNNESPLNGTAASMWANPKAFRAEVLRVHGGGTTR